MQLLIQRNIKSTNGSTHLLYPDLSHVSNAVLGHVSNANLGHVSRFEPCNLRNHSSKKISNQLMTIPI